MSNKGQVVVLVALSLILVAGIAYTYKLFFPSTSTAVSSGPVINSSTPVVSTPPQVVNGNPIVVNVPDPQPSTIENFRALHGFTLSVPDTLSTLDQKKHEVRFETLNAQIEEQKLRARKAHNDKGLPESQSFDMGHGMPMYQSPSVSYVPEVEEQKVKKEDPIPAHVKPSEFDLAVASQLSTSVQMIEVHGSHYRAAKGLSIGDFVIVSTDSKGITIRQKSSGKTRILTPLLSNALPDPVVSKKSTSTNAVNSEPVDDTYFPGF